MEIEFVYAYNTYKLESHNNHFPIVSLLSQIRKIVEDKSYPLIFSKKPPSFLVECLDNDGYDLDGNL